MAFGAKIRLSVDKSNKSKLRGEIQEFVNTATVNSPIHIKNFKIDISSKQRQLIADQIQKSISAAELTVKVKSVDASDAIKGLRGQLITMLGGLQIGGITAFLGSDGIGSVYDKASASADRLAQATENARKKAVGANAAIKEIGLIQNMLSSTYKSAWNIEDTEKLNQYISRYRDLETAVENARTLEGNAQKEAVRNISTTTAALSKEVSAQLESEKAAAKKAATAETAEEAERRRATEAENASRKENNLARQAIQLKQQINTYITKNTGAYQQYSVKIDSLLNMLQSESGLSAAQLSLISKEFAEIKAQASTSGVAGQNFFEKLKVGWSKFGGWSIVTKTMMAAVNTVKKMITAVKDLDAAMTELRKVTDLTSTQYAQFFDKASIMATTIGAKLSDTINATADFARLGYDIQDAATLAHSAMIYKNVGDGIDDVSVATESLISTIKAFGYEASDAMHIVDAFNEVGNNFAISSVGIGDALQKSASALAAAGNSMEESIGLIVGMNNVLQNPEHVGTILKTSSMYLRSAKSELEEAGESTEGMITSVSKLRDTLLGLTDVDIQLDENTFKSTFQIYKELSKVWSDLSDITKANVVEIIGGKRNANGITSLLTNFADAESSMLSAINSSGSAFAENEKYIDSIAGKIALLEAAFEKLSSGFIDSEMVKGIISIGTALINVLTALQQLNLILPLLSASITIIKGKKIASDTAAMAEKVTVLSNSIIQQKTVTDVLSTSIVGLSQKERVLLVSQIEVAVASKALTNEQGAQIISAIGLKTANTGLATVNGALTASFKALWAAIKANPIGILITIASVVIPLITDAIQSSSKAADEAIQKANEIKDAYAESLSSSKSGISSLEGMREQFKELSSGVDSAGKNVGLTNDQYDTYLSLVDGIINISPGLVEAYDSSGQAVLNYSTLLEDAIKCQETYAETQRRIYIGSGNDLFAGNSEKYKKATKGVRETANELFDVLHDFNKWTNGSNAVKMSALHGVSVKLFEYDAASKVVLGQGEQLVRDLQDNTDVFVEALRNTGAYTEEEIISVRDKINNSLADTTQMDAIIRENAEFMTEYFRDESWYASIPLSALDEFKTGLESVIDASKGYYENLSLGTEFGKEFSEAMSSGQVSGIIALSDGLKNGTVSVEEFNAAVADYGSAYNGTKSVRDSLLDFLYTLSNAQATPNKSSIDDAAKSYENLANTISDAEKSINLLEKASSEMNNDGGVSSDTVSTLTSLLTEEERLTDYITVQGDVLKLNTDAWKARTLAQYQSEIDTLQAENAELSLGDTIEENTRKIADNNTMIGIYTALMNAAANGTKEASADISDSYDRISDAAGNISKLGSGIEVTYDAYKSLIEADSRYAGTLEYQNGILQINKERYLSVTNAIIAETLAQAEAEQQTILTSERYLDLCSRINDLNDDERKELNGLNAQIQGYNVLANEINSATDAYHRFINASSETSAGRFEAAQKAFKVIQDTLSNDDSDIYGKIGREQFQRSIDFVLGEHVEINTPEFDKAMELVERYLSDEFDGVNNFFDDLVSHGLVDASTGAVNSTVQEIASSLNVSEDLVRSMIDTLNTYNDEDHQIKVVDTQNLPDATTDITTAGDAATTAQKNADALGTTISGVKTNLDTINTTPMVVNTASAVTGITSVSEGLLTIIGRLQRIAAMSTINVSVNTTETKTTKTSGSSGSLLDRLFGASAAGGSYKIKGGKTLVGELGMETVVDPKTNQWYTVGENGAQFVNLPKNAVVFNHEQTKSLFESGKIDNRGEAMLSGNAALSLGGVIGSILGTVSGIIKKVTDTVSGSTSKPTTNKKKKKKKNSGGGGGSSGGDSVSEEVKDPYEELKKHYEELNDQIEHLIEHQKFLYTQAERGLNYQNMESSLLVQAEKYREIMRTSQEAVAALQAKGAKDTDQAVQEMEQSYWGAYDDLNSILDQINGLYVDALTQKIDDVQGAYSNLSKAADEFSKYGGITVDTFQALIGNGIQYLSLLKNVDGQYTINKEGIENIIAVQKEQLAIESALSYIAQLKEALTNKDANAVQNLVSLTNQISDASWGQVYAQVALLKTMGLTDVQYQQILENIEALQSLSSEVITDIADGSKETANSYEDQKNSLDDLLDLTQDLIKYETEQKIDAIEDQIDAYRHLVDLKKEALQTTRDESKYEDTISEKVKEIARLQTSIDQLSLDDSRNAMAERLSLMEELAKLQKELGDEQSGHAYDSQVDALDKMADSYEEDKQSDIEGLENSINSAEKLYQAAIQRIDTQWDTLYADLINWNTEAGSSLNSEITENWNIASEAVLRYGSYLEAINGIKADSQVTEGGTVVAGTLPKYHTGGVVGSHPAPQRYTGRRTRTTPKRSDEIIAVLKNGEIVLNDDETQSLYQIVDFQEELSRRLGSNISPIDISSIMPKYSNISPDDIQRNITDNSTMVFSPVISVDINGELHGSDSEARNFGNKIATTALDALKDVFIRRGISNLGGAKLVQG